MAEVTTPFFDMSKLRLFGDLVMTEDGQVDHEKTKELQDKTEEIYKAQVAEMKHIVTNGKFLRLRFDDLERRYYDNSNTRDTQLYLNGVYWITDLGTVKVPSVFLMKDTNNPNHNFTLHKLIRGESIADELRGHVLYSLDCM